ncbi:MAG TPA: Gfo/Idh/MocA family oxidoreductase [Verrucomicrobia bacterium]|nr:Gfo/Idh/MocA family oxidoreductase [Verrucomicrobiota bacterium]HOB31743.1 Gfo/Idh/MocA family oxidoreductase [Verrucomicrobiota bacterium]HOP98781.1 Gfo/Idh/MocA family oxidoreductase [Verrucomicrobiota bacterium]
MTLDVSTLRQTWPRPSRPRPIVIIGAGGIVRDAHLPAYRKANFPVAGIYDLNPAAAEKRVAEFNLPRAFRSIEEAAAVPDAIFDVATPPGAHESVLEQLPDESVVVIQKPMGRDLEGARRIRDLCRRKRIKGAVNFQLRFSTFMLAVQDLVQRGEMGEIVDVEFRLNLQTPWELFPFLLKEPRVELLVHTIHYLDLIRLFLGNPRRVYARSVKHPRFPNLASTRSSVILDYGDQIRCCLSINHCHSFDTKHTDASARIEGTEGCAIATLGLLLDYPRGRPDRLEVFARSNRQWQEVPLSGGWFPDGFVGVMSNVQRYAAGEDAALVSSVEDGFETMRLVEACYRADAEGGVPL